jgi:pimeloyl-ACP methyl ester carboxylesterase
MSALTARHFAGRDGTRLAYRELGEGRPLVLLHGYFSAANENWVRYGHAATLAARGHRVIMPDLRAHGDSAKPHDAASYPPDVLADDALALVEHLGLTAYDLGGYSLGGRTVMRMLARGATPGRAVVAGAGLDGIVDTAGRSAPFRRILDNPGTFARATAEWRAEAFMRTMGGDPIALRRILDTLVDTPPAAVEAVQTPTLVLVGTDDDVRDSARELAGALPRGTFAEIAGNHMSAVTKRQLGEAVADYLGADCREAGHLGRAQ